MKKYKEPGTCDVCFWGREIYHKIENPTCCWHEGKKIESGQNKCNQFLRCDWDKKK